MRKEAASLIWGSSFVLLFSILIILSLFQYLFLKASFNRSKPDFPIPSSVTARQSFFVPLEVSLPFLFPGFRCVWKTELSWSEGSRSTSVVTTLQRGNKLYGVPFQQILRGVYKGTSGEIIIEDLFGFTRFVIYRGVEISLAVFPAINKDGFDRKRILTGGEVATAEYKRIRSDELLEVRKYYPGDDARRINWKMFAASGELFLRIGEEIPPPTGKVIVVLSSESSLLTELNGSSFYTDSLIVSYLAFIYSLIDRGCRVSVFFPSIKEPFEFDPEKPDNLLSGLAGITSESHLSGLNGNDFFYFFTHPGSAYLKQLVEKKKGEVKVFIKNVPHIKERSLLKVIFFRDMGNREKLKNIKTSLYLQKEVENNVSYLVRNGKGRIDAEII